MTTYSRPIPAILTLGCCSLLLGAKPVQAQQNPFLAPAPVTETGPGTAPVSPVSTGSTSTSSTVGSSTGTSSPAEGAVMTDSVTAITGTNRAANSTSTQDAVYANYDAEKAATGAIHANTVAEVRAAARSLLGHTV